MISLHHSQWFPDVEAPHTNQVGHAPPLFSECPLIPTEQKSGASKQTPTNFYLSGLPNLPNGGAHSLHGKIILLMEETQLSSWGWYCIQFFTGFYTSLVSLISSTKSIAPGICNLLVLLHLFVRTGRVCDWQRLIYTKSHVFSHCLSSIALPTMSCCTLPPIVMKVGSLN